MKTAHTSDSFLASAAALGRPLRIIVALPFYGGSLPVGRHVVHALRELGHTVEPFEAPDFFSAFEALRKLKVTSDRLQSLENSFLHVLSQAILAKAETFEPDLVLSMAQATLNRQALKRLKNDNIATAMWFVEDFRLFTYWRAFAPYYDVFAVIQKEPLLGELDQMGVRSLYLPMAARTDLHCPLQLDAASLRRFGSDVSFLGAGYPNRRLAFRQLMDYDFKIWGSDWEGETALKSLIQADGARISTEDSIKIFNATTVNINLHSSVHTNSLVSHGDFVNPRTFEVAACGAFQLVDQRALLADLFTEDELVTFTSMESLRENIAYFLAHPKERNAYTERARARVLAEHTYVHRMDSLLAFVGENFPWTQRQMTELPQDIPPHMAEQLTALLQRLQLPSHAPFNEVITRLRQESGVLSELETSLLFMDEWRKQYKKE